MSHHHRKAVSVTPWNVCPPRAPRRLPNSRDFGTSHWQHTILIPLTALPLERKKSTQIAIHAPQQKATIRSPRRRAREASAALRGRAPSTCRNFATISSGLCRVLAIAVLLEVETYLKSDHFNGGGSGAIPSNITRLVRGVSTESAPKREVAADRTLKAYVGQAEPHLKSPPLRGRLPRTTVSARCVSLR